MCLKVFLGSDLVTSSEFLVSLLINGLTGWLLNGCGNCCQKQFSNKKRSNPLIYGYVRSANRRDEVFVCLVDAFVYDFFLCVLQLVWSALL